MTSLRRVRIVVTTCRCSWLDQMCSDVYAFSTRITKNYLISQRPESLNLTCSCRQISLNSASELQTTSKLVHPKLRVTVRWLESHGLQYSVDLHVSSSSRLFQPLNTTFEVAYHPILSIEAGVASCTPPPSNRRVGTQGENLVVV